MRDDLWETKCDLDQQELTGHKGQGGPHNLKLEDQQHTA